MTAFSIDSDPAASPPLPPRTGGEGAGVGGRAFCDNSEQPHRVPRQKDERIAPHPTPLPTARKSSRGEGNGETAHTPPDRTSLAHHLVLLPDRRHAAAAAIVGNR